MKKNLLNELKEVLKMSNVDELTLEEVNRLLLEINKRDDIYVEWIDENDYFKDIIQKCKDYKDNLLDLTVLEVE